MRAVSLQMFVVLGFLLGLTALAGAADQTVGWKVGYMDSVDIVAGDTVSYVWGDTAPHDVRATGTTNTNSITGYTGTGVSEATVRAPFTLKLQFTAPGTYTFDCSVHPTSMKSTVNVAASAAPVATNATTPTSTAPPTVVTSAPTATTSTPAATPAVTGGLTAVTNAPTTTPATTTATPVATTPPSGAASLRSVAVPGLLLLSVALALFF